MNWTKRLGAGVLVSLISYGAIAANSIYPVNSLRLLMFGGATIATLRTIVPPLGFGSAQTSGYTTDGDGGAASYVWVNTSTATDDGCLYLAPTNATTGRWQLLPASNGLNPVSCGAKGDGVTDDTTPLQTTLNDAAVLGISVFIPARTFEHHQLSYPSGLVSLYGVRGNSVLQRMANSTANNEAQINSGVRVIIHDLVIDGNATNNTLSSTGILASTDQVDIRNVEVRNQQQITTGYGWGILFNSTDTSPSLTTVESVISDCYVHNNTAETGIESQGVTYNLTIKDNRAQSNGQGIQVNASGTNSTGDVQYITVSGNNVSNNTGAGIGVDGYTNNVSQPSQHVVVSNNVVSSNGSYGIAAGMDQGIISNNIIDNNGAATQLGGVLGDGSHDVISGNSITNNHGFGIDAGGASYQHITDNYFKGNLFSNGSGSGIDLNANIGSSVENNVFDHNAGNGGSEIAVMSYDGGGVWPAFANSGINNSIIGNRFLLNANGDGIYSNESITGLVVKNNTFTRDTPSSVDSHQMVFTGTFAAVSGNVDTDYITGMQTYPAAYNTSGNYVTDIVQDAMDLEILSGASRSISQFQSWGQFIVAGEVVYIAPGTQGSGCTSAPTITITNVGGSTATAVPLLNGPLPAGVGAYSITNGGSSITTATASASGGGCTTEPVPGAVQVGAPNAMDGRIVTIVNGSGNTQTIVNGTWIHTVGGGNIAMTNNSTVVFRVANGGIWYELSRSLQ